MAPRADRDVSAMLPFMGDTDVSAAGVPGYSTVTVFARFLGWSTSLPSMSAIW
jgi:hypothetical protein